MRAIKTVLLIVAVVGLMGVPGISAAAEEPVQSGDFQSFDETDGVAGGDSGYDDGVQDDGDSTTDAGGLSGEGDPGCGFTQIITTC